MTTYYPIVVHSNTCKYAPYPYFEFHMHTLPRDASFTKTFATSFHVHLTILQFKKCSYFLPSSSTQQHIQDASISQIHALFFLYSISIQLALAMQKSQFDPFRDLEFQMPQYHFSSMPFVWSESTIFWKMQVVHANQVRIRNHYILTL